MRDLRSAQKRYNAMAEASGLVGATVHPRTMLRPVALHAGIELDRLDRALEHVSQRAIGHVGATGDAEVAAIRGAVISAFAMGYFVGSEPDA